MRAQALRPKNGARAAVRQGVVQEKEMAHNMSRSTIQDVAALAGVSATTVSHVINETRYVSPQTKKAVLDAVEQLSYVPDLSARNLKTRKKKMIGFIIPTLYNSYFFNIIEAVESAIRDEGYSLLISNSKEDPEKELQSFRHLSSGLVDGIIAVSSLEDFSSVAEVTPPGFPILLIDRVLKNCACDSLTVSTYDSIRDAAVHLLRSGHSRITYLASDDKLQTTTERLAAFQDAVKAQGVSDTRVSICFADSTANAQNTGTAYHQIRTAIEEGSTAIFASTNAMTQEALCYLCERNLSPVKDVELVGLFNPPYICSYPGMWWINMPGRALGTMAGKAMLARLADASSPPMHKIICSQVITNS